MSEPNPLGVACPRCKAPIDTPSGRPNGKMLAPEQAHADRRRAAAAADAPKDAAEQLPTPEGRELYRTIVAELERRGEAAPWTRMLAFRAAKNSEEATTHFGACAASPTGIGSTGQEVAHPLWAVALRLEERVLADLKALRMTPDSAGWVSPNGDGAKDDLDELDDQHARAVAKGKRAGGA